jgi:NAD-dependent DNA ligase
MIYMWQPLRPKSRTCTAPQGGQLNGVFKRILANTATSHARRAKTLRVGASAKANSARQVIMKGKAIERRVGGRQITELVGICRGVLADGALVDPEVKFLADWMELNVECSNEWPYTVIYNRIAAALADGVVSPTEEKELLALLHKVTGGLGGKVSQGHTVQCQSTDGLPYDDPAPEIEFPQRRFCATGDFAFGSRRDVCGAIEERGGLTVGSPSRTTDFLVVGLTGSYAWKHSTHGNKIMKALELKNEGRVIAIVSEEHWTAHL